MSLLESDYNSINYDSYFNEEIIIKLPHGKLGIELEKCECGYIITQIFKKNSVDEKLKVEDLCIRLNNTSLKDMSIDKVELLFFKNILSDRLLTVERKYNSSF